ncbi:hypothetical protein NPIL_136711 [Nephila pilipes]|uniref:Uncharacterized protein n=1 Tax=Nephila pilipes TaxID=299642 RepID=A0A8X6MB38_NEPPI|nr:hypothetical protein NPIL_136711 [Nephila pilipes]
MFRSGFSGSEEDDENIPDERLEITCASFNQVGSFLTASTGKVRCKILSFSKRVTQGHESGTVNGGSVSSFLLRKGGKVFRPPVAKEGGSVRIPQDFTVQKCAVTKQTISGTRPTTALRRKKNDCRQLDNWDNR